MEYQEWKSRYYTTNPKYFKEYYKKYYEEIGRQNREDNKKECIYRLINTEGNQIYFGSTSTIKERMSQHLCANSNLDLSKEKWEELKCSHFEYVHVDHINSTERYFMEYYLINKFKDSGLLINEEECVSNKFKDIEDGRKIELRSMADELEFQKWDK